MERPADFPNKLECAYCIRSSKHGGECKQKNINTLDTGCLYFKMDDKGCIRNADFKLPFKLYSDIPPVGMWDDSWEIHGTNTLIRILNVYALSWDKSKGLLFVHSNCDYYVNEFSIGYLTAHSKPSLKVIK